MKQFCKTSKGISSIFFVEDILTPTIDAMYIFLLP